MDKAYNHKGHEKKIYDLWEKSKAFTPKIQKGKKPFIIVLPPPNASGKMHTGNALMIAIEDILIRWHRMMGDPTLWIPGTDHAGFETQTTFERELKKENKSRFDFDRDTLYKMIWDFVQKNKGLIEGQIKEMGASVDWSRLRFTLDNESLKVVYSTFQKMYNDGLIYRGNHLVNYSFKWGTTFSDAEIQYKDQTDPLYFIKYKLVDSQKHITLATVRPETIMVDTHLVVNPKGKNKKLVGQKVLNPITNKEMEIIADPFVDENFGTGIVKLTPAHDKNDYEVALKQKLPIIQLIEKNGKLNDNAGKFSGMKILEARQKVVEFLQEKDMIDHIDKDYTHQVPIDYRSGDYIENLIIPNWFVKVDDKEKSFKQPAYEAVKNGEIKIHPKWRTVTYLRWMENLRDWPISRQTVWGIRIPVWYKIEQNNLNIWVEWINKHGALQKGNIQNFLNNGHSLDEIKKGLQSTSTIDLQITVNGTRKEIQPEYSIQVEDPSIKDDPDKQYIQGTDTFDTWFSSGQWPLITTGYPDSPDFKYFYPTSVLETGWEIVTRWVSRMVMFGYYLTNKPPFTDIYLHGIVKAVDGRKMSKSLGNVINPDEYIEEFGTDALRMGLISGTANGKDFNFPKDKIIGYKKFANKIWNMARFMQMLSEEAKIEIDGSKPGKGDEKILRELQETINSVNKGLEKFRFSDAAETIYQFMWHTLADIYIEEIKKKEGKEKEEALFTFQFMFRECLKLLHPFMPFITETIYQELFSKDKKDLLIISSWPSA